MGGLIDIVSFIDLSAGFKSRPSAYKVLEGVTGSARSGELISVIGANGSGKSTLLKTITGILPLLGGEIEIFGKDLSLYSKQQLARKVGYVSAGLTVSNSMSVEELVTLGRFPYTNWIGRINDNDRMIISESIESVGLSGLRDRNLFNLSDGEKQRAMIARALAQDPSLLVLDEPMAFLDLPNRYELVSLLRKLAVEHGKAILFSTHDLNIAVAESDKIWLIQNHKLAEGAPEDLLLTGEFISLFGDSKLHFSEDEGTFRYPVSIKNRVKLISDEKLENLTTRALQRLNIGVTQDRSDHTIRAENSGEGFLWHYSGPEQNYSFKTIYDLCLLLKKVLR